MIIHVKSLKDRKTFDIACEPTWAADAVKAEIAKLSGISESAQRLVFAGKPLGKDKSLAELGVQKGATLHLVLRLKTYIELTVRVMSGRSIELEQDPHSPCGELSANVIELLALDVRPRVLIFEGRRLEEGMPLAESGLKDHSLVHIILVPQPNLPSLYKDEADRAKVYGMAGSLYARCGGIFGVAQFVDRCMDAWMADPVLNANKRVATWHQRAQRCGFKFLVTQLMGYQAGGPQVYTGRDMASSHKHLAISDAQWEAFMGTLAATCDSVRLPPADMADLLAVISSMKDECVLAPGERAPPQDRMRDVAAAPTDTNASLYARLGGVYPIALFCDRLVDALLSDRTVNIPLDGKRTSAALKYFFTELVCNKCGGPEALTGNGLEETRLLASSKELFQLLRCAEVASDHITHQPLRTLLLQTVYGARDLILDPNRTDSDDPHGYVEGVRKIAHETTVPMAYIPGGGAVFFAGRDQHFGTATPKQQAACWEALQRLGFRRQRVLQVKSVDEAAAGATLSDAAIKARQASAGSFVEARQRVYGDARTLYGRVGGIFGLAKLADRLMDSWMTNPTLNGNAAVAPWTQSGQRQGFKFLVTQVCGYLTGGPQRYTGQPMDVAHKHLGITPAEWATFMTDAGLTMDALHIDKEIQAELGEIFDSFRSQCVVEPGERVPPDPKQCRKAPDGDSTYAQAGGVYPLAAFADTLLELAIASPKELSLRYEDVKKPGATRHPPGLKYVLTELLCHSAGGPEVLTAEGFDDAKLSILPEQFEAFMGLVKRAAEQVWPANAVLVSSVEALVQEAKPEICIGLVASGAAEGARKLVRDAGYSHVQTTAALLECGGDGPKALDLLKSGWALPPPETLKVAGGCPFKAAAAAANGKDGAAATAAAAAAVPPHPVDDPPAGPAAAALPAALATAVKTMAGTGMAVDLIATTMKLDVAAVEATLAAVAPKPAAAAVALPEALANAVRTMAANGMAAEAIAPVMKLDLAAVQQVLTTAPAKPPVDVTDGAAAAAAAGGGGGKCPFGFDRKGADPALATVQALNTNANPALLVETLRERFSTRLGKAEGHVAGRVLSNDKQKALDDLLVEPAELCCPITLMLLTDPVIASDGCVYERAAITIVIEQGKLSPLTLTPLAPELFPAGAQKAKVLAFWAERTGELLRFADEHKSGLVDTLASWTRGLVDTLGLSGAEQSAGAGGVQKLANWEKRVHAHAKTQKEHEVFDTRRMVSNALDRAQLYLSSTIASSGAAGGAPDAATKKLAKDFHELASAMERPMSVDILALAAPTSNVELRLRLMTGEEATVLVPATSTVRGVIDAAVAKCKGASKDKGRVLVHESKGLPPSSTLDHFNLVEGSLLTLILTPTVVPAGEAAARSKTVAQLLADQAAATAQVCEVRAYGQRKGGVLGAEDGEAKQLTLYARCGGIFGVAAFVDRCMDAWMADPVLNANKRVATWHQRAQRCGFKFLVTQLMGYLCGGPQVYTGRDMASSHKHLDISEEEWDSFIAGMHDVCSELGLPQQEVDDVTNVISSMRSDCIVLDGETAPANPGHDAPLGDSLYARAGGVYPLALVCDRLVDALLSDESVRIEVGAERTMGSLKYLFTELVCAICGGPETMTAAFAATRLQLSATDFFKLLGSVSSSADHLESPALAVELAERLYEAADLILKEPFQWFATSALKIPADSPAKATHEAVRQALEAISAQVKTSILYVPNGKAAFLLALEQSSTPAAKAQRREATMAIGFEESEEMPGVAMVSPPTDKDMVLLIDTSGSMSGPRIMGATDNALKIYKDFTTEHDHVALLHFNQKLMVKFALQPVSKGPRAGGQQQQIDATRKPEWGGTAFYDALIKAVKMQPKSTNSYLVALTDGADLDSKAKLADAEKAIAASPWTLLVVGLQVSQTVRVRCEQLANASAGGMYMHAGDAGGGLDAAFAAVAAQFVMPKVKSADAAASGGGSRGV